MSIEVIRKQDNCPNCHTIKQCYCIYSLTVDCVFVTL